MAPINICFRRIMPNNISFGTASTTIKMSFAVPLPPPRMNPNQPRPNEKLVDPAKQSEMARFPVNESRMVNVCVDCDPSRRASASSSGSDSSGSSSTRVVQFATQSESDIYRSDASSVASLSSLESLRRSSSSPLFKFSPKFDQNLLRSSSISHPRFIQERGSESWRDLL